MERIRWLSKSIQSMKYVGKRGSRVTLRAIDRSVEIIVVRSGVESEEMRSLKETLRETVFTWQECFPGRVSNGQFCLFLV